jgi:ferric-dicitrate binding protein FerR (iron transport regulator)
MALVPQQDTRDIQAVVVKVVRDVQKKAATTGWQKAVPADRLRSGYQLRTDDKSLAMVMFPDQSKLIIRAKSIVEIKGQKQDKQIVDRSVHVERGRLAFEVKKQEREQFRFSSPISVASIRGTKGGVDHTPIDTTSTFVCTQGAFDVDGLPLLAGQTYQKRGSGQGRVRNSTGNDNNIADQTEDVTDEEGDGGQPGQPDKNRLELIGRDASGKEIKVRIE